MAAGVQSQTTMLGGNLKYVYSKLDEDPEFSSLKIDTLESGNMALMCKSNSPYPYFIFEFSEYGECVSYTVVSNNRQVYATYMDFLTAAGSMVNFTASRKVFHIRTMESDSLIYTVSEPFQNSDLVSKRSVFSVQIEKK